MRVLLLLSAVLLQLAHCFHVEITLHKSETPFVEAAFLADLAKHMNNIVPSRLTLERDRVSEAGLRVLRIRVGEGQDHAGLKKKVIMVPFGGRTVGGFTASNVEIHEDEPIPTPAVAQVLKLGCIMDTAPVGSTLAAIEAAIKVPAGSLVQTEVKNTVVPKEAFQSLTWLQLQATNGAPASGWFTSGVTVFFEVHTADDHVLDNAVMRTVELPWLIPHIVSVAAGVIRDVQPPPPPAHPVDDGAACGQSGRELCMAVVIKGTAQDASSFQWKCRLSHYLRIHNNRVRYVTHSAHPHGGHPAWADIKIDKEYSAAASQHLSLATFAISEGDPTLASVHGHMLTDVFHAPELVRVSAGFIVQPGRRSVRHEHQKDGYL